MIVIRVIQEQALIFKSQMIAVICRIRRAASYFEFECLVYYKPAKIEQQRARVDTVVVNSAHQQML